jgi:hypothetical protein
MYQVDNKFLISNKEEDEKLIWCGDKYMKTKDAKRTLPFDKFVHYVCYKSSEEKEKIA